MKDITADIERLLDSIGNDISAVAVNLDDGKPVRLDELDDQLRRIRNELEHLAGVSDDAVWSFEQ